MLGKGHKSLGHALFKSMKLAHILHLPELFFTIITLANQVVNQISLMKPIFKSFFVSSKEACWCSVPNLRFL